LNEFESNIENNTDIVEENQ